VAKKPTKETTIKKVSPKTVNAKDKEANASRFSRFQENWLGKSCAAILAVTYVLAVVAIYNTRIIPGQYLYLSILVGQTAVVYLVYLLARKKKYSMKKNMLLGSTVLVVMLGCGYIINFSKNTNAFLSSIQSTSSVGTKTEISKPYTVLISGVDTYGEVEKTSRSDVNIIAVVNPESKKILLVNTPRDYFVQLHGTTGAKDKLTHAGIYGIEMSKNTLQDLYETDIDYTVRVNFTSLLNLVDALGGISVQSDQAFKADGYNFVAGTNQLNAKQALAFSRERYSFSQGDRQRGKNQQKVIEAVVAKASQPDIIVNYQKILATLSDSFQTNASKDELSNLIKQQLDSVGQWKTESISVDGTGSNSSTYSMGRQALYVMVPDMNTVNLAKTAISSYKATSAQ
jgi:LCP family protein required for cell wall assembly